MKTLRAFLLIALVVVSCVAFGQAQSTATVPTAPGAQQQAVPALADQLTTFNKGLEELVLSPELEKNPAARTEMKNMHGEVMALQQNLLKQTNEQLKTSLEGMQTKLNGLGPKIAGETQKKVTEMVTKLNVQIDGMVKGIMASTEKFVDHTVNQAMDASQKALDAGLKQGMDAADAAIKQAQQETDAALKQAQETTDAALRDAMQGINTGTGTGE